MILIYEDDGVSAESVNALFNYFNACGYAVYRVTAHDLQQSTALHNVKLFIMPGGRSLPFYEKLGSVGNQHIVDYVKQGGCYFGLCAGAYYASKETVFASGLPLALNLPGALNFFQGRAIGPVFEEKAFAYATENGARMVDVIWKAGECYSVYFNGGCYFENAENNSHLEVLARYRENQQAAIVACLFGKGRAILSGVHPELSECKRLLSALILNAILDNLK